MFELNGIVYAGSSSDLIKILDARVTGSKMLLLTFSTGEKRVFDAEILTGEVYEPLCDDVVFRSFTIVRGVMTWMNGEIDCAPEYMYDNSYAYTELLI